MVRFCLLSACMVVSMLATGCCGPMGCGPGCGTDTCYNCDGTCGDVIPYGPFDGIHRFKKRLMCGEGCGGTYMGEWISTPPDACDPCCDGQWVGGAHKCRPFCWRPGSLLKGLYGSRFCTGAESSVPCGCGDCCDTGCCDTGCSTCGGGYVDGGYVEGEVIHGDVGSTGGCATCNSGGYSSPRYADESFPTGQTLEDVRMDERVNRIRR